MRGPGKTQPQILRTEQRRARVLALRTAGFTYRAIAAAMWADMTWRTQLPPSYNARHCHEDVCVILLRRRKETDEAVQVIRQQEIDRLDRMLLGVWSRAQNGDDRAIQSVLGIMARRARLIPQLETPQQITPMLPARTCPPAAPEDVQAVAAQLAAYGLALHANGNGRGSSAPADYDIHPITTTGVSS